MRVLFGLLAALLAAFVVASEDYYAVLGVARDASERDIKKAYRALSRQYHPDKNRGNDQAHDKFVQIATAYEILGDKEQRAKYDRFGVAGLNGGHHADPMDLFSQFFGNNGRFGQHQQQRPRGPDWHGKFAVSLKDSYNGAAPTVTINLQGICDDCAGSGDTSGNRHTCRKCQGAGHILVQHQLAPGFVQRMQMQCNECGGRGSVIKQACPICKGTRVIREDRTYNLIIPAGAPRQWDFILEGEGDQSPEYDAGNLVVTVIESADDNFGYRRRGLDLFRTEAISELQAQKGGWSREIRRLTMESKLTVKRDIGETVYNGEVEVLEGEGMHTHDGESGSLYIRYVVIPSHRQSVDEREL